MIWLIEKQDTEVREESSSSQTNAKQGDHQAGRCRSLGFAGSLKYKVVNIIHRHCQIKTWSYEDYVGNFYKYYFSFKNQN